MNVPSNLKGTSCYNVPFCQVLVLYYQGTEGDQLALLGVFLDTLVFMWVWY